MKQIYKTHEQVKSLLTEYPDTRNNDMLLYLKLAQKLNPDACHKHFDEVLLNLQEYCLPAFETVRRTRQKLQAEYPELRGKKSVQLLRSELEEDYREYARS